MRRFLFSLLMGIALLVINPVPTHAAVELSSGGDTLTALDDFGDAPDDVTLVGYTSPDAIGTSYDLVFNTNGLAPAVIVAMGASIDEQWTFDADTSLLSISLTTADFGEAGPFGSDGAPEGVESFFVLGMVPAVEDGQDGPPDEATGMYMATNIMNWQMVPPSEDNRVFGFILSGPEGHDGFFDFFVPNAMIEMLETTKEDLVLFVDDNQDTIEFTDLDAGALFNIKVTFTAEESTEQSTQGGHEEDEGITKEIVAREALPVSLATNTTTVDKGKKVQLYGWVNNVGKGKKVRILRKIGDKKYKTLRTVRTKADGYFSTKVPVGKTTTKFKAQYLKKMSPEKTITVE